MALLSRVIRTAAVTGRTDAFNERLFGRQGGRWAEQKIAAAFPARSPPRADTAETMRKLMKLHQRGDITNAELEALRARMRV